MEQVQSNENLPQRVLEAISHGCHTRAEIAAYAGFGEMIYHPKLSHVLWQLDHDGNILIIKSDDPTEKWRYYLDANLGARLGKVYVTQRCPRCGHWQRLIKRPQGHYLLDCAHCGHVERVAIGDKG